MTIRRFMNRDSGPVCDGPKERERAIDVRMKGVGLGEGVRELATANLSLVALEPSPPNLHPGAF